MERTPRGLWVSVPDKNGYDRNMFLRRVAPHLSDEYGIVAEISKAGLVDGQNKVVDPGDRAFGLILTLGGIITSEEVPEVLWQAKGILETYFGLKAETAVLKRNQDGSEVRFEVEKDG